MITAFGVRLNRVPAQSMHLQPAYHTWRDLCLTRMKCYVHERLAPNADCLARCGHAFDKLRARVRKWHMRCLIAVHALRMPRVRDTWQTVH